MEAWQVIAALASAALHAGWNAAVKARPNPASAMTAQMVVGAAISLPALLWTGLPARAAWPWIAASTAINTITVLALLRAYVLLGFGTAYPLVRACSVLLVVPFAALLAAERVGLPALAGIGLIAASLVLIARGEMGTMRRSLVTWVPIAGIGTAAYVLCDAQGVRQAGAPAAYGLTLCITNAAAIWAVQHARREAPRLDLGELARALPVAVAAIVSYVLILWVWTRAPVAPSAALRDTSAIFAILIAVVWLKEPLTGRRLAAVLLTAAAVPLLRLG